ncbi:MAG TPA: serine protein kinase RIO [Candidatus Dormibacteraeota bacterium]|nr:serine protein kinase RIO [Candidatus Dormibacteraeota bacterium]
MSNKPEENLRRREERYDRERRVRLKVGEDIETMEEVFDGRTLMTVMHILNTGKLRELQGTLKSGKESRIYHGIDPKGKDVAVKIYLTSSAIFKQGRLKYIRGDPRFKDIPHDTRSLVDQWALKEFKNLELAAEADLTVPKPIHVEKNVLLMEFIGKNGVPAPHLRDVPLQAAKTWYDKIVEMTKDLHDKAKLVHGDLSEYNILVPDGYPVLIDFAQAVTTEHPEAMEFLRRDIENLNNYFKGLNVRTRTFDRIFKVEK